MGISLSTGEYIAFLDSDDIFLPGKLARQIEFMETQQLYFSHTSYLRMDMHRKPLEIVNSGSFAGKVFPRILASCGIATSTVMVKREILNDRKFKEDVEIAEDVCLWIDIAYNHIIGGIDEPLTAVRIGSSTAAFDIDKQRRGFLNISNHIIENPAYAVYQHEHQLLLNNFLNFWRSTL